MFLLRFIVLLFVIQSYSGINFFTPCNERCPKCHPCLKEVENDVEVINVNDMDTYCLNHRNECVYDGFCAGFKYVYNPFKDIVSRKRVLPACVRCAQCLAISDEVRKMFDDIIEKTEHLQPDIAKCMVHKQFTEDFCKRTFTSHDLRNCNGDTIFCKMEECGTHIRTEFDGQWPTMLKNMCLLFVHQLDYETKYRFFHQFWTGYRSVDDFLCRGDGVFRECKNLVNKRKICNCNESLAEEPEVWYTCLFNK